MFFGMFNWLEFTEVAPFIGHFLLEFLGDWMGVEALSLLSDFVSKVAFVYCLPMFLYFAYQWYSDYDLNGNFLNSIGDKVMLNRSILVGLIFFEQLINPMRYDLSDTILLNGVVGYYLYDKYNNDPTYDINITGMQGAAATFYLWTMRMIYMPEALPTGA